MYEGIRLLNLSCPAVSQSCRRTVRSSKYIVCPLVSVCHTGRVPRISSLALDKKSMPIVAWYALSKESYIKRVINEVFPTSGTRKPH